MRLTIAVISVVLAANVASLAVLRDFPHPRHGYPDTPYLIFFMIGMVQTMLFTVWLSSAANDWRKAGLFLIYVGVATALHNALLYTHNPGQFNFIDWGSHLSGCVLRTALEVVACASLLWIGCYRKLTLQRCESEEAAPDLFRPMFSLKLVGILMTVLAVLLALGNKPFGLMAELVKLDFFSDAAGGTLEGATRAPALTLLCWSIFGPQIRWWGVLLSFALIILAVIVQQWYLVPKFLVSAGLIKHAGALAWVTLILILYRASGIRWSAIGTKAPTESL